VRGGTAQRRLGAADDIKPGRYCSAESLLGDLPHLRVSHSGLDGTADEPLVGLQGGNIPRRDRRRIVRRVLELFGELLVMPTDSFAGAVVGVPAHIRAEPACRRRTAECLGHRAEVVDDAEEPNR
jgi:hypothetical protein